MMQGSDLASAPSPTDADPAAVQLDEAVRRFLRCGHILGALLREILEESFLGRHCPHPLTRTQFCLLKLSTVNAELPLSEVARYLGMTPAAMTKNADKLEQLGLVTRASNPADRRTVVLSASRDGVALVGEYEDFKAARIAPVVAGLGASEVDELCDLLEGLCVDLLRYGQPSQRRCLRCAGYFSADCLVGIELGDCALRPRHPVAEAAAPEKHA
jgi:DNA-binding MarR family transcriptional regulator